MDSILYDRRLPGPPQQEQYALFQEAVLALRGKDVFQSVYEGGAFCSGAASPVVYRNAIIGAVYLYEYDNQQGMVLQQLQLTLGRISWVILGAALLLGVVLARTVTLRISRLLAATQSLQEGEYTHRVKIQGNDELTLLADQYNKLTQRLQETDEVRRRFVSDASHELKTPLATIRLLTDSILQSSGSMDEETMREFVSDIGQEAGRLNRITEKLLSLTRLDSGQTLRRDPVALDEVTGAVLHTLAPLAESKGITFETQLPADCVILSAADDIYQVIYNLVENAIKYNCPEGLVRVLIGHEDDRVFLRVEDTGIGIPESEREKIFDRFYRVDKARSRAAGGAGLGLSIVRDTVHRYGGWLSVSPRVGGGSCFQVTFPAAGEAAQ
jgi:signal transduction histidine kinase